MIYSTQAEATQAAKELAALGKRNTRFLVCRTAQGFRLWPGMNFAEIDAKPQSYRTVAVIA